MLISIDHFGTGKVLKSINEESLSANEVYNSFVAFEDSVEITFFSKEDHKQSNVIWIKKTWTVAHVHQFLVLTGLEQYADAFQSKCVDGKILFTMERSNFIQNFAMDANTSLSLHANVQNLGEVENLHIVSQVHKAVEQFFGNRGSAFSDASSNVSYNSHSHDVYWEYRLDCGDISDGASDRGTERTDRSLDSNSRRSLMSRGTTPRYRRVPFSPRYTSMNGSLEIDSVTNVEEEIVYRIVMVGVTGTGKRTLMRRFGKSQLKSSEIVDIVESSGVSIKSSSGFVYSSDDHTSIVNAPTQVYIRQKVLPKSKLAEILLIMFDLTNRESFNFIPEMITQIRLAGIHEQ